MSISAACNQPTQAGQCDDTYSGDPLTGAAGVQQVGRHPQNLQAPLLNVAKSGKLALRSFVFSAELRLGHHRDLILPCMPHSQTCFAFRG